MYDWGQRLQSRVPIDDIVIVAVDEQSLDRLGRWPWSRRLHGDLVRFLDQAGARVIVLDFIFAEPSDPDSDAYLGQAMRASGRVVLPVVNERHRLGGQLVEVLPIPELTEMAAALGHVNRPLDTDTISRSVYLKAGLGEAYWPSVALATLQLAGRIGPSELPGLRIPQMPTGSPFTWVRDHHIWLSFVGPPGAFPRLSYVDVLQGAVPVDRFQNKMVLVGATAAGLGDVLPTPVSGELHPMPGVEIIANEIDTLLTGRMIQPLSLGLSALISALLVFVPILLFPRLPARSSLPVAVGAMLVPFSLSIVMLLGTHTWYPPIPAIAGSLFGYLMWSWRRLVHAVRYLNQALLKLDAEPAALPKGMRSEWPVAMRFLSRLLPIQGSELKDAEGRTVTAWGESPIDPPDAQAHLSLWQPVATGEQTWRLGVRWHRSTPPDVNEMQLLNALAQRFAPEPVSAFRTPVERMQQRIQQVEAATERLQVMRRFITDALAQMVDGVIVADRLGMVLMANPQAAQRFSEYDHQSMAGQTLQGYWEKLEFESPDFARQALRDVIVERITSQAEARSPDGKDLLLHIAPFRYGPDDHGLLINLVDITPLRHSERRRLELLAFLSHDLRSPLASILAVTEIARMRPEPVATEHIDSIARNARRTLQLADDFLQLAQADSADHGSFATVDLVDIACDALDSVADHARSKHTRLVTEFPERAELRGDQGLLQRALLNMLSNAIKYGPHNSTVTIGIERRGPTVHCWVQDTGYGIEAESIVELFDRFHRIHRKEHAEELGSGLGLAFVKTVVERHRGTIEVESVLNEGTCFRIQFPALDDLADQ